MCQQQQHATPTLTCPTSPREYQPSRGRAITHAGDEEYALLQYGAAHADIDGPGLMQVGVSHRFLSKRFLSHSTKPPSCWDEDAAFGSSRTDWRGGKQLLS